MLAALRKQSHAIRAFIVHFSRCATGGINAVLNRRSTVSIIAGDATAHRTDWPKACRRIQACMAIAAAAAAFIDRVEPYCSIDSTASHA